MFICILSPLCVHISERVHLCVGVCVCLLFVCVCVQVWARGQELKRPWDEYVEQM